LKDKWKAETHIKAVKTIKERRRNLENLNYIKSENEYKIES